MSRKNRRNNNRSRGQKPMRFEDFVKLTFKELNEAFFEGELPMPDFYVGRCGSLDGDEVLGTYSSPEKGPDFGRHKICFNPNKHLQVYGERWCTAVVDTLLHEMTHFWCYLHAIDDMDGDYHTEAFHDAAIAHGLECRHRESDGWDVTSVKSSTWFRVMMFGPLFEGRLRAERVMRS